VCVILVPNPEPSIYKLKLVIVGVTVERYLERNLLAGGIPPPPSPSPPPGGIPPPPSIDYSLFVICDGSTGVN
jgi:hypothetical protein